MENIFYEFPVFIISEKQNESWQDDSGEYLAIKSASMVLVGDIITYFTHPASAELLKEFNTQKFIVTRREFRWVRNLAEEFPYTPTLYLEPLPN